MNDKIYIKTASYAADVSGLNNYFQAKRLRRLDNLQKLALLACAKTLDGAAIDLNLPKENIGLIIATGKGPVVATCGFMDSIIDDGDTLASPLAFSASVHNSLETAVTLALNLRGACVSLSGGAKTFENALTTAKIWLSENRCESVLLCAADEINPVTLTQYSDKIIQRPGAAAFLICKSPQDENVNGGFYIDLPASFISDEFNPSLAAFNLARSFEPFILPQEAKRIARDFVKTSLAGSRQNIMSVFENQNTAELLKNAGENKIKSVCGGLKLLCAADKDFTDPYSAETEVFDGFKKSNRINFFTSGSAGIPKNCIHLKESIDEEIESLAFLFKDVKRIVATVPSHHSYGFIFTLKMPRFLDIAAVSYPPVPTLKWAEILQEGDMFVTFPMFLKILDGLNFKFPQGVRVLTSTAPCPDELIEKIYASGAARLTEIYGASESGAIAYRQNAYAPFNFLPCWDLIFKNGIVDKIKRKKTSLEIEIPDILAMESQTMFRVSARKDNAVQVAGVNVYPSKVEAALKLNPFVKDAAVRLGGERLKAFIVLKDGVNVETAKKEIHSDMQKNLSVHEMPKNITFGDKIPLTPFGKKSDW
ncbi:MAG: beta-ketoacyl synthase chain length factor [Endomicrobium sp.]|jgi:4-coumarate--CoA ligase (photoactive yellow protein activation family)|nr:beta-ketoacyl synthase chain length factor [Endomicrobium sp.]